MTKDPKPGDPVSWNSHGGTAHGKVVKKVTSPTRIKDHKVAASTDNPELIVETGEGKRAAHKAGRCGRGKSAARRLLRADPASCYCAWKQGEPLQQPIIEVGPLQPFLKWAGGKRWIAPAIATMAADHCRYIEPFLGGAALFFTLRPTEAILSDKNQNLIELFSVIRDYPAEIFTQLTHHAANHSSDYYYKIRSIVPTDVISRASRMLYLNRTCWNGLYRVNREGIFNVPKGTKDKVILENDFNMHSNILSKAKISCSDFEDTIDQARAGDFVFADPPYTVKHNNNGFVKYNEDIFKWQDQIRLRDACARAAARGASVIICNADHASIRELYTGIGTVKTVNRRSVLAGKAAARVATSEALITMGVALGGETNDESGQSMVREG